MFKLKTLLPVIIGLLLIASSAVFAAVPSGTPPACNDINNPGCYPPINVSTALQKKDGPLNLGSLLVINSASVMGKLGIGAASPIPNGPKLYIQDTGTGFLTLAMLKNTNLAGSSAISFNSGGADAFWGINGPNRLDANPNQVFMGNGNANGGFLFFTGGGAVANERMRITSTGNVGIGTTAPGAKLEVAGQVKITGGTPGAGKVLTSDASGLASWQSGGGSGGVVATGMYGYAYLSGIPTVTNAYSGNTTPDTFTSCEANSPVVCKCDGYVGTGGLVGRALGVCYTNRLSGSVKSWEVSCPSGYSLKKTGMAKVDHAYSSGPPSSAVIINNQTVEAFYSCLKN